MSGGAWWVALENTLKLASNYWENCVSHFPPDQPKTADVVLELSVSQGHAGEVREKFTPSKSQAVLSPERQTKTHRKPRTSSAVVQVFLLASAKIRCCHLRNNFLSVWNQVLSILWMLSVWIAWVGLFIILFYYFRFVESFRITNICVCVCDFCVSASVYFAGTFRQATRWTFSRSVSVFPGLSFCFCLFFRQRQDGGSVCRESRRISGDSWWAPRSLPHLPRLCFNTWRKREKSDSPESAVYKFV